MNKNENFLDKNTIISVCLVFALWIGWDFYMRKKYPSPPNPSPVEQVEKNSDSVLEPQKIRPVASPPSYKAPTVQKNAVEERFFSYQSEKFSFQVSSQGMGLKDVKLIGITDREDQAIHLFKGMKPYPFTSSLVLKEGSSDIPLAFHIEKQGEGLWRGTLWLEREQVEIEKVMKVVPEAFSIKMEVKVKGNLKQVEALRTWVSQREGRTTAKPGFFSFDLNSDYSSFFVSTTREVTQYLLDSSDRTKVKEISQLSPENVEVFALGTRYFGQAYVDVSDVLPELKMSLHEDQWRGILTHKILNPNQEFVLKSHLFIGPKSLPLLKETHTKLLYWVDFGWFGSLSRIILLVLRFFYSVLGNWGWSIVLLTLLVRMIVLPFVLSSHRSMEVMKKIQPLIKEIREKHKNDKQRMNQEVMAVMKSHKANPLGGCLPMLLQIPVFWALWQALSNSYSLYKSPFVFWIKDLSLKDPYYVLPIGIGGLMFLHQSFSPPMAGASKEMVRMFKILPVFMSLFMLNLPSGLTLYVLVSTFFGILQQAYISGKTKK